MEILEIAISGDHMRPVRLTRKEHILDYCKWFFANVKGRATSLEMANYAIDKGLIKNNMYVDARRISGAMRGNELFQFDEKRCWSLRD